MGPRRQKKRKGDKEQVKTRKQKEAEIVKTMEKRQKQKEGRDAAWPTPELPQFLHPDSAALPAFP